MASVDITMTSNQVNVSLQVGDTIYATLLDNNQSGTNTLAGNKPIAIGIVTAINGIVITIDNTGFTVITLTSNHYLFFSKDRSVNTSGISGYYASVEYKNHSLKKAEMFATGTEYAPSSK